LAPNSNSRRVRSAGVEVATSCCKQQLARAGSIIAGCSLDVLAGDYLFIHLPGAQLSGAAAAVKYAPVEITSASAALQFACAVATPATLLYRVLTHLPRPPSLSLHRLPLCPLHRCNKLDSCCEAFEHCVSCCMSPEHKPEERRKETPRAPNNKDSGVWADVFEYCLAVCRTHGRSTSHENAYIGPRHHCFSKLGKPMVSYAAGRRL
jgi:hypothetical protein